MTLTGMAHLPGTGPGDTRCGECSYFQRRRQTDMMGRCRKAAGMRGKTVMRLDTIPEDTYSCKFWCRA